MTTGMSPAARVQERAAVRRAIVASPSVRPLLRQPRFRNRASEAVGEPDTDAGTIAEPEVSAKCRGSRLSVGPLSAAAKSSPIHEEKRTHLAGHAGTRSCG